MSWRSWHGSLYCAYCGQYTVRRTRRPMTQAGSSRDSFHIRSALHHRQMGSQAMVQIPERRLSPIYRFPRTVTQPSKTDELIFPRFRFSDPCLPHDFFSRFFPKFFLTFLRRPIETNDILGLIKKHISQNYHTSWIKNWQFYRIKKSHFFCYIFKVWNHYLSHTAWGGMWFLMFFCWCWDVWTNFRPLQKSKTSRAFLSTTFISWKGACGSRSSRRLDQKLENEVIFDTL